MPRETKIKKEREITKIEKSKGNERNENCTLKGQQN